MNPWIILGFVVALILAGLGGERYGHGRGVDEQKVADQKQFDTINKKLTDQKAEANAKYREVQDANLALMVERDRLKTQLGEQDAKNRKATADLDAKYRGLGLRFAAAQGAGSRDSGGRTEGTTPGAASVDAAAVIQLPDTIASDLRQLALDADRLKDDYALCYGYATKVK